MKLSFSWLFLLSVVIIVPIFMLSLGNNLTPRVYDYEQFPKSDHIVIKFSHVVAESTPKGQAALLFARLASERTGGRVEVQVYPDSSLYMDGEEVQALQQGHIQLIAPATAKMTEHFPFLLLFDLPFLFQDYPEVHSFMDSPTGQEILQKVQGDNLLALAMWDNGFKQMIGNRPFVTFHDFQDTVIRIMPSCEVLEKQFASLGARPVALRFSEVLSAKIENEIDGSENTPSNIYSQGFHLVHHHLSITNHGYLGYIVLTNKQFWMSLPGEIRSILEEIMVEVTAWEREQAIMFNEIDLQKIKNFPEIKVSILSNEDKNFWRISLAPLYAEFLPQIGERYLNKALSISTQRLDPSLNK